MSTPVSDLTAVDELALPAGLPPSDLRWTCDPASLPFDTTVEVEELVEVLGQPRAVAALEFGIGIAREGYHVFVLGPDGSGRHAVARQHLERRAADLPPPSDWCYVHDFEAEHKPRLLRLPGGRGRELRAALGALVEEIRTVLAATFESEEYQGRRRAVNEELASAQEAAWARLAEEARERGLAVARTPVGVVFAASQGDKVLSPEEYEQLPEAERQRLEQEVERLRVEAERILRRMPRQLRERRRRLEELDREAAKATIGPLIEELRRRFEGLEEVRHHLDAVERDLVERARLLARGEERSGAEEGSPTPLQGSPWRRYEVNLLVDHGATRGAPIVYEDHPTFANLVGRVEHLSQLGTLITDFTLIKAGALHRANGGFLLLDALEVLRQPFVWDALKRMLRSGQLKIESLGQALSLVTTTTLEPEPMPLEVKVVMVGEPRLYYLLCAFDPDFGRLFKVAADFEEDLDRNEQSQLDYTRLMASMIRREGLRPFDRSAVARLLEQAARRAGDARKLSLNAAELLDLLREADYWGGLAGREVVGAAEVEQAVTGQIFRADRLRARVQERIERGSLMIATDGEVVGQVNGLAVVALDRFAFGYPSRITARARMGDGEVVDIEREVELAGPIHSKGVLILSGFLGQRYAPALPLSLSASLVFEQSYGGVEGDSASLAELCALLSAIGELPVRQALAVTGSVNQLGGVQPVGGIDEKIEGFFDVCRRRGLAGQGVIIPAVNAPQLMLRSDVVAAVAEGSFRVLPVATVDEAMELLTGLPAGARDEQGELPPGSVNGRVELRLTKLAVARMQYQKGGFELGGGEG